VNLHIRSIDQNEALKMIKRKITDIDGMKITEQKRAVRQGYDMEIMPSDLNTYGDEAKKLLQDLQNRNEKMFLLTVVILGVAGNKQTLENRVFQMSGIAQKHNCTLLRLDYMQEQGLMSSLPLGLNQIPIQRGLTTSGAAIFIPFMTQELFQSGEALYYGRNAVSGNIIMADRKRLRNPNGLILGTPGSGKSFAAKREITNAFLISRDDIIICDPENEYGALIKALDGQVIRIAAGSSDHINAMDMVEGYGDSGNPVIEKSEFILSLFEQLDPNHSLSVIEKGIIDHCVKNVYEAYQNGGDLPTLSVLQKELRRHKDKEAEGLAKALELFTNGSLNVFAHPTNVNTQSRMIVYDILNLGSQLKTI
jgi:type IV secretory pathway VirB4 component